MLCDSCKHPLRLSDALPTTSQTQVLKEFLRSSCIPLDPSYYQSQIAALAPTLSQYDAEIERLLTERSKVQDYVDGCQAALSPVRHLPPEILCEIFVPFTQSSFHTCSFQQETAILAQPKLLGLSQVCSHWHRIVLGTPRLWSDVAVNFQQWRGEPENTILLGLLRAALDRGARHPLNLWANFSSPLHATHHSSALRLLADHCRRWQHVYFAGPLAALQEVSHIEGKLDALETLSLDMWQGVAAGDIPLFKNAPKLTSVCFNPQVTGHPELPWNQLCSFEFYGGNIDRVQCSVPDLMHRLSHPEAAFELRRFCRRPSDTADIPPATATVSSFLIAMQHGSTENPEDAMLSLGRLLNSLTLPRLCSFNIPAESDAVCWPVKQFESLCLRSSFRDTLRVLEIPGVIITTDELISSLGDLPSLERLVISDQEASYSAPDHILITSALLRRFTLTPTSFDFPILLYLNQFVCMTLFMFSAQVYFDFVVSRIVPGKVPFHCILSGPGYMSLEFDPEVHQKLLGLVEQGELQFDLEKN